MNKKVHFGKENIMQITIAVIVLSLLFMIKTDSYYSVYLFGAFTGIVCLYKNNKFNYYVNLYKRKSAWFLSCYVLIALCILTANYQLFIPDGIVAVAKKFFEVAIVGFSVVVIVYNILVFIDNKSYIYIYKLEDKNIKYPICHIGLITFISICVVDMIHLFGCAYPGRMSYDSFKQVSQIISGSYSNHHPYWHTMLIKICVEFGTNLFGDINAGVACYSVLQIILLALSFTYLIVTLCQVKAPFWFILISILYCALMPYNIEYSITMWKDVPFGLAVLVFITSIYRVINKIGKQKWLDWILLFLSSICICIWRSNGKIAFGFAFIIFLIMFLRKYKKVALILGLSLFIGVIMVYPVLSNLGVNQPDFVESLSIPTQQIARVIAKDGNLDDEDIKMLSKIMDIEKVKEVYEEDFFDPVKGVVEKKVIKII